MEKRLTRIPSDAVLGGVAAGMADYFNIDKTIVRVIWAVALLLPIPPTFFWTAIVYIILWVALPEGTVGSTHASYNANPDPASPSSTPRDSGMFANSSDPDRAVKIIGVVLLGIGAIMLLDELPYWYQIREYIWPIALIGVGAYLLLRQRDKEQYGSGSVPPTTPPADPNPPVDPFPPVEPDPVPYRPFDAPRNPSIDPDAPSDPDGETNRNGDSPQIK